MEHLQALYKAATSRGLHCSVVQRSMGAAPGLRHFSWKAAEAASDDALAGSA